MEITAKRPWLNSLGDVPATLDYFQGSMVEAVEKIAEQFEEFVGKEYGEFLDKHVQ